MSSLQNDSLKIPIWSFIRLLFHFECRDTFKVSLIIFYNHIKYHALHNINVQLIDGSVVRSNHMIGFNQSGHLCCSLAFRRTINRLRPSTSSLATWSPPRIPIFSAVPCKARARNVWRDKEPQTGTKWITRGQRTNRTLPEINGRNLFVPLLLL